MVKRVLLEEFSTAPCGFCPEGGLIAEELLGKYPNLISFTHHAGFGIDSMTIPQSSIIAGLFTTFAPAGVIDRGDYKIPVYTYPDYIGISRQKWDSVVSLRLSEEAEAEVTLTNELGVEDRILNASISVRFVKAVSPNDFRFNLAIIEDSVSGIGPGWDQKNYFNDNPSYPTLYHKGDPYIGYMHRHVLRALPTGTWGVSSIIPNNPEVNYSYTYNLNGFKIPDRWKIKDLSLVAFVSSYNSNKFLHKILNSVQSEVNIVETKVNQEFKGHDDFSIKILPNPTHSNPIIEFKSPVSGIIIMKIYNQNGKEVLPEISNRIIFPGLNSIYLNSSSLNSGVYLCAIKLNEMTFTKELIIEK